MQDANIFFNSSTSSIPDFSAAASSLDLQSTVETVLPYGNVQTGRKLTRSRRLANSIRNRRAPSYSSIKEAHSYHQSIVENILKDSAGKDRNFMPFRCSSSVATMESLINNAEATARELAKEEEDSMKGSTEDDCSVIMVIRKPRIKQKVDDEDIHIRQEDMAWRHPVILPSQVQKVGDTTPLEPDEPVVIERDDVIEHAKHNTKYRPCNASIRDRLRPHALSPPAVPLVTGTAPVADDSSIFAAYPPLSVMRRVQNAAFNTPPTEKVPEQLPLPAIQPYTPYKPTDAQLANLNMLLAKRESKWAPIRHRRRKELPLLAPAALAEHLERQRPHGAAIPAFPIIVPGSHRQVMYARGPPKKSVSSMKALQKLQAQASGVKKRRSPMHGQGAPSLLRPGPVNGPVVESGQRSAADETPAQQQQQQAKLDLLSMFNGALQQSKGLPGREDPMRMNQPQQSMAAAAQMSALQEMSKMLSNNSVQYNAMLSQQMRNLSSVPFFMHPTYQPKLNFAFNAAPTLPPALPQMPNPYLLLAAQNAMLNQAMAGPPASMFGSSYNQLLNMWMQVCQKQYFKQPFSPLPFQMCTGTGKEAEQLSNTIALTEAITGLQASHQLRLDTNPSQ